MNKFNLGDKVFIKCYDNKEGIITCVYYFKSDTGQSECGYRVAYPFTKYSFDSSLSCEVADNIVVECIAKDQDLAPFTTLGIRGVDGAMWAQDKIKIFEQLEKELNEPFDSLSSETAKEDDLNKIYVDIGIADSAELVAQKVSRAIEKRCTHNWTTYTGFTDVFDYCSLCNCRKME